MIRKRNNFYDNRLAVLATIIFIVTSLIVLKLVYLMLIKHDYYIALANNQHYANAELDPTRGEIYLQDYKEPGKRFPFATNRKYYLVYANTTEVKYPQDILSRLVDIFKIEEEEEQNTILRRLIKEDDIPRIRLQGKCREFFQ